MGTKPYCTKCRFNGTPTHSVCKSCMVGDRFEENKQTVINKAVLVKAFDEEKNTTLPESFIFSVDIQDGEYIPKKCSEVKAEFEKGHPNYVVISVDFLDTVNIMENV